MPIRNAVLRLSRADQIEIEQWLVDHGFGQLRELSAKLCERGIDVGRDSLRRFGNHLRAERAKQATVSTRELREVVRQELRAALREVLPVAELRAALREILPGAIHEAIRRAAAESARG